MKKKFVAIHFFHLNQNFHYAYSIIIVHAPQISSLITFFNKINDNNFKIKLIAFALKHGTNCKDIVQTENFCLKIPTMTMIISFDVCVLLTSVTSELPILSYFSICTLIILFIKTIFIVCQ